MDKNYDVVAVLRSDLTAEEMSFITKKIEELKQKLEITQDGNTFYRQRKGQYDDFGPGVKFFAKLRQYSEYFDLLEYNSYLEGILHGTVCTKT